MDDSTTGTDPGTGVRVLNAHGYPDGTPLTQMSVDEQTAYWTHQSHHHAQRINTTNDTEQVAQLRKQLEQLQDEHQTETEKATAKAVAQARDEALEEARSQLLPVLHEAQIRGYAATKLTGPRLDAFVTAVNPTVFMNDAGAIDGQKVIAHLDAILETTVPEDNSSGKGDKPKTFRHSNYGQGSPGSSGGPKPGESGKAEARRRYATPDSTERKN